MAYSDYSDYIIYVDESGSSNLSSIEKNYPIFVLDFCIFKKSHYNTFVGPKIQAFKFDHFGHDNVILHEHKIRNQIERFKFLQGKQKQTCFMNGLSQLIQEVEVSIVAVVIKKPEYKTKYINPRDLYVMAMLLCMERAYMFLKDAGQHNRTTHIIVERRGKKEDARLSRAFQSIRTGGYSKRVGPMSDFEIELADKKVNSAGLQLADLTARPIGLHVIRPEQPNRSWDVIKDKICRNSDGDMVGYGLKIFP